MKTIVFQGDSITDASRDRQYVTGGIGVGYVNKTVGKIRVDYPGEYQCFNRGISGNCTIDMYARIKADVLNLKPDILTVLIGVNDVWRELKRQDGMSAAKYEMILELFIKEIREKLPDIKMFFMEPFLLHGTATDLYFEEFQAGVKEHAEVCKRVAERHGITYIPLQDMLSAFAEKTSNEEVLIDGVHPTCCGHELISRELYKALQSVL